MLHAQKIALFGGTFDPPHLGHLGMARRALDDCALDFVIFIPCRQSPHKDGLTAASGEHRHEMLRRAFDNDSRITVSGFELDRPEPSYSWQTARHFAETFPGSELFWILGQDQWKLIDTWRRADYLRENLTFIVFPRNGDKPAPRNGYRSRFTDYFHPASATDIRARLALGEDVTDLLHPSVLGYIREHGLYRPAR